MNCEGLLKGQRQCLRNQPGAHASVRVVRKMVTPTTAVQGWSHVFTMRGGAYTTVVGV